MVVGVQAVKMRKVVVSLLLVVTVVLWPHVQGGAFSKELILKAGGHRRLVKVAHERHER